VSIIFKTGLEVLIETHLDLLCGCRVGLVSHPAAVTDRLRRNVEALLEADLNLTALFGPEHGFSSTESEGIDVNDALDSQTGLPVYSLYGNTNQPTPEMFQQVDVLIFDLQDVGVRFYTYLSTLFYLLKSCAQFKCPLIVLDRPNPITGLRVAGPVLERGWESFVGMLPLPVMHGMTLGELARLINVEYGFNATLTVIPMKGWRREQWFDQTRRIWVPTSPGMPRLETAIVYPGMCLLEGTNLSEGRGTALPFEIAGAPWLDGHALADRLNGLGVPGVIFRSVSFAPHTSKHQGKVCQGVQLHLVDRLSYDPLLAGLEILAACLDLSPTNFTFLPPSNENERCHFDLLAGSDRLRLDLSSGMPVVEIIAGWEAGLEEFTRRRNKYLLYDG
jgi:uncharacterized protein YbbC (DUF1343 family)